MQHSSYFNFHHFVLASTSLAFFLISKIIHATIQCYLTTFSPDISFLFQVALPGYDVVHPILCHLVKYIFMAMATSILFPKIHYHLSFCISLLNTTSTNTSSRPLFASPVCPLNSNCSSHWSLSPENTLFQFIPKFLFIFCLTSRLWGVCPTNI